MKKLLTMSLAILFVLGLSVAAMAGDGAGIAGSVHDLRSVFTGNTELCGYCHAPHSQGRAEAIDGPLWAHTQPDTTGYTMYTYTDLDGVADAEPTGISKACLGCHDGTVGLDEYQGLNAGSTNFIGTNGTSATAQIPNPAIGVQDMSGTHPISVTYADFGGAAPSMKDPATSVLGTAGFIADFLQENKVQCHTCHDVHNDGNESVIGTPLLRETDAGSALCTSCHVK